MLIRMKKLCGFIKFTTLNVDNVENPRTWRTSSDLSCVWLGE